MASKTSVTLLGTATPWRFSGSGVNNPGTPNTVVAFASGFNDGTDENSNHGGQNTSFRFGRLHTSGDTAPQTISCSPNVVAILQWNSGTIATQASGAGNNGPSGSFTATESSLGPNETDGSGYNFPSNYISGSSSRIGGICGCFVNSTDDIIAGSLWDFDSHAVVGTFLALTSVANASGGSTVYTGTITGGGSNAFAGLRVVISGFGLSSGVNNGTFYCTASTATTLTLSNASGVAETKNGQAGLLNTAVIYGPADATTAKLSIGINDSTLSDNTGSFALTVAIFESNSQSVTGDGGTSGFPRFPIGIMSATDANYIFNPNSSYLSDVFMQVLSMPFWDNGTLSILRSSIGQIFPTGRGFAGTSGQGFP